MSSRKNRKARRGSGALRARRWRLSGTGTVRRVAPPNGPGFVTPWQREESPT